MAYCAYCGTQVPEVSYRPCATCGKMMNRVNFGHLSGTVIDVCRGHGTFLDAGELHAIVTFINEGGLDRARQREKDDLEEERHRLANLKTRIEATGRVSEIELRSTLSDHILIDIWTKFVRLTVFSGMTAVTRCSIGPIREDPELLPGGHIKLAACRAAGSPPPG